jgi:hypothetical protein
MQDQNPPDGKLGRPPVHAKRKSPFTYETPASTPTSSTLNSTETERFWSNELNYGSLRYLCKVGTSLEAAMAAKQFGQKDKSGKHKQQEANLGQKDAAQEKEKNSELSSMGENTRESSEELGQKPHSD